MLGTAWRHNYDSTIVTGLTLNGVPVVFVTRAAGNAYSFVVSGATYQSQDPDINDKLIEIVDGSGTRIGWTYTVAADDAIERYNASGKLVSITDRRGMKQLLTYSDSTTATAVAPKPGLLIQVADSFNHSLKFIYDSAGRISTMTDPAGAQYTYHYDSNNDLMNVAYPGGRSKTYRYNEQAYTAGTTVPHALTGIVDENAVRYASYYYNAQGKAVAEQHAGSVDQYSLNYDDAGTTTITDPLGSTRTTSFTTIFGVAKATGQSQPGGAGCGSASSTVTYDANGNLASRTDWNGTQTTYTYDLSRNLETSRTEAAGTPQARTITTAWHPTYRLPLKIAEPKRRTTFTHDANGNVLTKTIQATTDATGAQAFSATLTGAADKWTYTYNAVGQVLTIDGPRTDATDKTTYAYGASGNLVTITNAAGHVTTLSNYDAHGHAGRIVDPNGIATDLTYHPRGWLASSTVTDGAAIETTTYAYDGVGQLTSVTLPKGAKILYTYDDAHRLTAIADSLGNKITYTLDNMGNRINEQVKDPGGALARQTSRLYDALNRLQQVTGGVQ